MQHDSKLNGVADTDSSQQLGILLKSIFHTKTQSFYQLTSSFLEIL